MSKPDSTGESLESILASIRRSLAEQSTGVLEDEPTAPATLLPPETGAADDMDVPRLFGGAGAASPDAPTGERESLARFEEDPPPPSTLAPAPVLDEPPPPAPAAMAPSTDLEDPPPPAPAAVAAASPPAQAPKDPFWFLSGRGEGERKDGAAPASAAKVPVPEPKPARTEIVRGPLPPFFGSSAEAAKVDAGPAPAAASPARAYDDDLPKGAPAEAPRTPAWPPGPPASPLPASPVPTLSAAPLIPPAARERLLNGKASPLAPPPAAPIPGPAPGGAAEASPHLRGLEGMVAELLRPMLRRWLDENMPRLVSAALKAEAEVISKRDPKKP